MFSKPISWLIAALILITSSIQPVTAQGPETRLPLIEEQFELETNVIRSRVAIFAEADGYIASNRPTENFGNSNGLLLGHSIGSENYGRERILLRFNVQETIPAHATIHSARLLLYLNSSNPSADSAIETSLQRLAAPWNEYEVNFTNKPEALEMRSEAVVGSTAGWYEWEVKDLTSDWVKGNWPNYGLEIASDPIIRQRERVFYARESESNLEPRLIVDFTVEPLDNEAPITTVEPLPTFSFPTFTVSWSGYDPGPSEIAYYDVEYRANGGDWRAFLDNTASTSSSVTGQNGVFYEFRVRGIDLAGNVEPFADAESGTIVDGQPPTSRINPLPALERERQFTVSWSGTDGFNESGVRCYDIRYRVNRGPWLFWNYCNPETSTLFKPRKQGIYEFEVRAVDYMGNQEPFTEQAEARTRVIRPQIWLPVIRDRR